MSKINEWLKQSPARSGTILAALLVGTAILVRASVWYAVRNLPASDDWMNLYDPAATALANGASVDLAKYAWVSSPIYVIFLAVLYRLFGIGINTMRGGMIFVDGLIVLCIFWVGKMVYSQKVAALAAGMYVLYPPVIYMAGLGQPEVLLALCLMGLILTWLRASSLDRTRAFFPVGLLIGVSLLLKPNYIGFFPLVFVVDLLFPIGKRKRTFFNLVVILSGILVLLVPWYILRAVFSNPFAGNNTTLRILYFGSFLRPGFPDGSLMPLSDFYTREWGLAIQMFRPNSSLSGMILNLGISNWLRLVWPNPLKLLAFLATKFAQTWYATDGGIYDKYIRWGQLPVVIVWLSGVIGVLLSRTMRTKQRPLLVVMGYTFLALLAITPLLREFLPAIPIVLLFTAFGIERLTNLIHGCLLSRNAILKSP